MKGQVKAVVLNLIILTMTLAVPSVSAFEQSPEYGSLTEDEQEQLDDPMKISPEFQSHLMSYAKPEPWRYLWLSRERGLELAAGSTGPKFFKMDNELKIHHRLVPELEMRFTYFDDGSAETQSSHHALDAIGWAWPWVGVGFYTEYFAQKRKVDTGLAITFRPSDRQEIRLFHTWVDVARLKRNDRNDTFEQPDLPRARGVVGRFWSDPESGRSEFLEVAFRHETPTLWKFPDTSYQYRYWKLLTSVFMSKHVHERMQLYLRVQWDRKFESKQPTATTSSVASESWTTDRLMGYAKLAIKGVGPRGDWEVIPGFAYAYRYWSLQSGRGDYRDFLPLMTLRVPAWGPGKVTTFAEFGYTMTYHNEMFEGGIPHRADKSFDDTYEHQLTLAYELGFGPSAELRLIVGLDGDELLSKQFWNGGAGQLRLAF